jgi:hypothetical protein
MNKKLALLSIVALGLLLTSCYKEPEKGVAKITIYNTSQYTEQNVNILLTGPAGSYISVGGVTNFKGEWTYEHDPALEVILNVHAWVDDGTGREAEGIIRITPDKVANESYTLYP